MMDTTEEIPQLVPPEKKPCVDGETLLYSPIEAVAVTKVLDDDNLLREIIIRVGLPTTLVRAALVCKRWLGHASDPKFLSDFRKLHPPRLLGYYIYEESFFSHELDATCFVLVLPQPPELATVMRRLETYNFGTRQMMMYGQDEIIFTERRIGTKWTHGVHHPLCAEKGMQIVPPLPRSRDRNITMFTQLISKEDSSSITCLHVLGESTETGKPTAHLYMLQDGEWVMRASSTCPYGRRLYPIDVHIGHNKIYLLPDIRDEIIVLDLMASSFSTIQLPQGVKYRYVRSMLSRADDASSIFLIDVMEFQLRIWLHKGDGWSPVDTICLREMFSTLGVSTLENYGIADVLIRQVGDNGQFVILQMGKCIFYLDIKCRTMCKVYESTGNDRHFLSIHTFMMIWPPTFPAIQDDPARFSF